MTARFKISSARRVAAGDDGKRRTDAELKCRLDVRRILAGEDTPGMDRLTLRDLRTVRKTLEEDIDLNLTDVRMLLVRSLLRLQPLQRRALLRC